MKLALVALLVISAIAGLHAQKINATLPAGYTEFEPEVKQRQDVNYTGFVFNTFDPAQATDTTPNGNQTTNFIQTNPFLATLPNGGNGQNVLRLGPCAGNTMHTHPRGSEISTVLYGKMTFGMVDENSKDANQLILRNISQYETIHIPQGLLHFSFNDNCEPAAFLANFGTRDPGTQSTWNSVMQVPSTILHMSTGIPEAQFDTYKRLPLVLAPGTGGEACLRRCGISFQQANHFLPNALNPTGSYPAAATAPAQAPAATIYASASGPAPAARAPTASGRASVSIHIHLHGDVTQDHFGYN